MIKVIKRRVDSIIPILVFLLAFQISCSQNKFEEIDTVSIWRSKITDSLVLMKANVERSNKLWTHKNDSLTIFYYRNLRNDSIKIRIGNNVKSLRVDLAQHKYIPYLIFVIPKNKLSETTNFELTIYDCMKTVNFNIDKDDIKTTQTMILSPYINNQKGNSNIFKDSLEVRLMEYDYEDFIEEIRK